MNNILVKIGAFFVLVLFFPFLSYRAQFWRYRMVGLAFTMRNRKKFKRLGSSVFLSSDLVLHAPELIEIGDGTSIGKGCSLTAWQATGSEGPSVSLRIGERTAIGEGAHITAANSISIGNNVLLGKYVTISDNNHGTASHDQIDIAPYFRRLVSKGPIVIEDSVWIGNKATILAGVTLGRGAIIAANSVVTKDVPSATIAAGVPAKIVKAFE